MGLTQDMGRFVAGAALSTTLPPDAIKTVRLGFTDCIACLVTGWNEPVTRTAARGLGIAHDGANTPISALQAPAPERALIYGVASHAIDYDDTGLAGHPSAILVPTILAEAAEIGADGRADDRRLRRRLRAVGRNDTPRAAISIIARAGIRPRCSGRSPRPAPSPCCADMTPRWRRARSAIAASLAGGIVGNFGSMTKPYRSAARRSRACWRRGWRKPA